MHRFLILLAFTCGSSWGWQVTSTPSQTVLLELYTSEGCSSCPAADRWLSSLKKHPGLWKTFIPVAFHVDYWDWIGWPDRFATAENSDRQRQYQLEGGTRAVYTPGFVVNGEEWRDWFEQGSNTLPPSVRNNGDMNSNLNAGVLTVQVTGRNVLATYQPPHQLKVSDGPFLLELAISGFDQQSHIGAGENRGKILIHDFVVLHHQNSRGSSTLGSVATPETPTESPRWHWQFQLPEAVIKNGGKQAINAWVRLDKQQAPLQAVGGWWPP